MAALIVTHRNKTQYLSGPGNTNKLSNIKSTTLLHQHHQFIICFLLVWRVHRVGQKMLYPWRAHGYWKGCALDPSLSFELGSGGRGRTQFKLHKLRQWDDMSELSIAGRRDSVHMWTPNFLELQLETMTNFCFDLTAHSIYYTSRQPNWRSHYTVELFQVNKVLSNVKRICHIAYLFYLKKNMFAGPKSSFSHTMLYKGKLICRLTAAILCN